MAGTAAGSGANIGEQEDEREHVQVQDLGREEGGRSEHSVRAERASGVWRTGDCHRARRAGGAGRNSAGPAAVRGELGERVGQARVKPPGRAYGRGDWVFACGPKTRAERAGGQGERSFGPRGRGGVY